jgi:hypothetical protein
MNMDFEEFKNTLMDLVSKSLPSGDIPHGVMASKVIDACRLIAYLMPHLLEVVISPVRLVSVVLLVGKEMLSVRHYPSHPFIIPAKELCHTWMKSHPMLVKSFGAVYLYDTIL